MITVYKQFISEKTVSYLVSQFPGQADKWIRDFDAGVDALCAHWRVTLSGHERDSRFGTILYGDSEEYGPVAVKIVPRFCSRLQSEIKCYRHLPYREMCPLYDVDDVLGAMLLKYISKAKADDERAREALFDSLYDQRMPATNRHMLIAPRYESVLTGVMARALTEVEARADDALTPLTACIRRADEAIKVFRDQPLYLIHGDVHQYNMMPGERGCTLIDPLGYIAPFEFELTRYLGTATRDTNISREGLYAMTERIRPKGISRESTLRAFAIDTTLRTCNTFIEGNTDEEIRASVRWTVQAWNDITDIIKS